MAETPLSQNGDESDVMSPRKAYDFELIYDTYMLMAHCQYRLSNPVLYTEYYEKAKKFIDYKKLREVKKQVDMKKIKEEF